MIRKLAFPFILSGILLLAAFRPASLEHPPIPAEDDDAEKVAIVLTDQKLTKEQISTQLRPFSQIKLRTIFKHALTGYSVKGPQSELRKLETANDVNRISEVNTYQVEKRSPQPSISNKQLGYRSSTSFTDNFELIGSDAVRSILDDNGERLTGKGVTIGVIDTGIDYEHPDLRKNFAGGQDLVDDDDDPMETKAARGKEMESTLHGTHVAGIIAANGRMRGMAPDAKIVAYRALGPGGSGTTEQVLAAIDAAIEDKVDILNLSLGNDINGPDLPISLALNKAVEKGVVAVTASGNSGPKRWTVGSPGTSSKAISVGASTPPMQVPYLNVSGINRKIRLSLLQGSDSWNMSQSEQLVFTGLGEKADFANAKNKIALVQRGKLTFTEKAKNALEAGAIGVIIYNNTKGEFFGNLEEPLPIPVAAISKHDGEELKKNLGNEPALFRTLLIEERDLLADFSSRGPVTSTWEIKPDIVAPGVAINSTVPGGYLSLQGTSMAAPHVAGACALIKQAHPEWTPAEIKAAIMNTAKPLANRNGSLYRTFEQGAGRIQLEEAIKTKSLITPASLQFGKFQLADEKHRHTASLEIKNTSSRARTYTFSIPKRETGLEWEIPLSIRLEPEESKKVEVAMKASPALLRTKIHDGRLVIDDGENIIVIPYLYVLEEPDYPRVMGFDFAPADNQGAYRYEVYLPGGADEFGIALFDPDHYRFIGFLDWGRKLEKGMVEKEIPLERLPDDGVYLAKIFAKKAGRESSIEALITIGKTGDDRK